MVEEVAVVGEHTVAWVHTKSTCDWEEFHEEYSGVLEGSKKVRLRF